MAISPTDREKIAATTVFHTNSIGIALYSIGWRNGAERVIAYS
jgi:hypothetical protein